MKKFEKPFSSIIIIVGITIISIMSGCSIIPESMPVNSDTGAATVGSEGGTISVGDETSPIYGAKIDIPGGALNEDVKIEIVDGSSEYIDGQDVQLIKFLPEGLEFSEPAIIGLPWSTDNQNSSSSRNYYVNQDEYTIKELEVDDVDIENKITYSIANHFSSFFNKPQYYIIDRSVMINNNEIMAFAHLYTPLSNILPKDKESPYANAEDIVLNNPQGNECMVRLNFDLFRKERGGKDASGRDYYYLMFKARQQFFIKYKQSSEGWEVTVIRYDNPLVSTNSPVEIYKKTGLSQEQLMNDWLSGFPVIARFTKSCFINPDLEISNNDEFDIGVSWTMVKRVHRYFEQDAWTWGFARYSSLFSKNELNKYENDSSKNNIDDNYELDNDPPLMPTNPQPLNFATDVSIDAQLSWESSDPDGDEVFFSVYFGTSNPPPYVGYLENSSTYNPSGLEMEQSYYWQIEAVDEHGATTTGPVWEFTTESESAPLVGCGGVTTVEYEGKTYHTLEIGDQCWLKENLNVGTMIAVTENQTDNGVIEKYCYYDDENYCDQYGGLYQWDELMQYLTKEKTKGICPAGWHVASSDEWKILEGFVDTQYDIGDNVWDNSTWRGYDAGKKLKSASGWFLNSNGTDDYGFSVYPSGYANTPTGFSDKDAGAYIWNSSASARFFAFNNDKISLTRPEKKNGNAVRCIKD
ncbi:MAG: FISUMP domain-containing protein [Prolixibacteraceae bacterium]|jgi:uncharacterized protein (TIGR02145 family)|nr:FISUMP domain-containing protein [Prolixibacteraceae bacterium]